MKEGLSHPENAESVHDAFRRAVAQWEDNDFLHVPLAACERYSPGPITLTYGQVRDRVDSLAPQYRAAGYRTGHRVALALENRVEYFVHFLALNSLGVGVVPINMELSGDEIAYVLDHSDAALVVALAVHVEKLRGITATSAKSIEAESLPVIAQEQVSGTMPAPHREIESGWSGTETEAALLYTSGTTARPKGCVLSNAHCLRMAQWYTSVGGLCKIRPGEERLITPLPLYHANALVCSFMAMLWCGGCVVQLDRFHPTSWWRTVRESRATIIHYLGVMPAMLLSMPASDEDDFSQQVTFGFGAGVDPRHQQVFEQRHGFPLIESWAMTETGAGAIFAANEEPRHPGTRCIGRPDAGTEYRLVDESGLDVSRGTAGELLVRHAGPDPRRYFFSSYYKDREATEAAWLGGWLHTGDIAREGDDGSLYFVDRQKNIIRRSGENIAAVEVEGVLLKHPAVRNCAVAPVPDPIRGEEVAALIVLKAGVESEQELAESIFEFSAGELAYYKLPAYTAFVDALPMTGSQKIRRGVLKGMLCDIVERGSAFDLRAKKKRPDRPTQVNS